MSWISWNKNNPPTNTTTPAATAPAERNRPEEYLATNCSSAVGLGGKNSKTGVSPINHRAARLKAGETGASGGSCTPNSSGA